jgi:hypothetical protein
MFGVYMSVIAGLVPATPIYLARPSRIIGVGRDKPGDDGGWDGPADCEPIQPRFSGSAVFANT